ncbi:hypothetical protein [Herbaspirillum sp. B65]|uniref:hypothetical protein n=1 Tax=Herbaspirillum sp. B65 TaxID=137708 RepID=UPI0005CA254C|nr:hypothetical protein [Herbaspirillum sp. B65]
MAAPAASEAPVEVVAAPAPVVPQQISLLDAVEASPAVVAEASAPVAPAPVVAAPAAATTPAAAGNGAQWDSLQQMLSHAGLTLATTDPVKLRAAQEAAAAIVPAPRVPRERKPLPPQSSEPLVQVETRR